MRCIKQSLRIFAVNLLQTINAQVCRWVKSSEYIHDGFMSGQKKQKSVQHLWLLRPAELRWPTPDTGCCPALWSLLSLSKTLQTSCRRPADKPSALHVEIDGASDPLCVRHDVFKGPKAARVQKEVKSNEGKEAVRAGEEQSSNIYLKERGLAGGILWDRTLGRCIDNHWELCSCCVLYSAVHPVSSASRWMLRMIEVSLL